MNKTDIETIIDDRMRSNQKMIDNQMQSIAAYHDKLLEDFDKRTAKLIQTMESLASQEMFLSEVKKFLMNYVDQEISVRLSQEGVLNTVVDHARDEIKRNMSGNLKDITREIVGSMNRELNKQYSVTKDLVYSIDAEVRHLTMRIPISEVDEAKIRDVVATKLEELVPKTKLLGSQ
jgi:hypothetical protein